MSQPGHSLQHPDTAKIFVGGLSWQTNEESLRWHFEQYGPVVSVEVMRDRNTGEPRGFGFVVFGEPTAGGTASSTVEAVLADKGKHFVNHKSVDVKPAQQRGVAPPSIHSDNNRKKQQQQPGPTEEQPGPSPEQLHAKVFVGGLPPHVDRNQLKTIFEQFGPVGDAIVMVDQQTQRSRGFGFVTFAAPDGAAAAQRCIDAQPVPVEGRSVEVKLATPREGTAKRTPGGGVPKQHLGLRSGQVQTTGEYAGLAVAFGRSGWKAGYGTKAFGKLGWNIWEDTGSPVPELGGFSFDMLKDVRSSKRPRRK